MTNTGDQSLAVVTGSTGFVGSELCKQLLLAGYRVRGTVRDINSSRSKELLSFLKDAVPEAQVELMAADLLVPGSFDEAVSGAQLLFHVASPFAIFVADPQKNLVEPAVQGTRNVMLAAAKHKHTLKRVIVTSSVAAVHDCHQRQIPKQADGKWCELDFNETSTLEGNPPEGYWVSKVQAEKEAWALASEHGLDLVTILPEFILGPVSTKTAAETSLSAGFIKGFLEAPEGEVPTGDWLISDVRDVATAHILAATLSHASGRYIVSQPRSICAKDISGYLKGHIPSLAIPDGKETPTKENINNAKAQEELGLKLTSPSQTICDMASSLISLGFAAPKQMHQDDA